MVGQRPKQFIGQHDYHVMEQGKMQGNIKMSDTLVHILQLNNK